LSTVEGSFEDKEEEEGSNVNGEDPTRTVVSSKDNKATTFTTAELIGSVGIGGLSEEFI
jgi:hypothetical protein